MPPWYPPLSPLPERVLASRTAAPSCSGLREQVRAAAAWRTPAPRSGEEGRAPGRGSSEPVLLCAGPRLPFSSAALRSSFPEPLSVPAVVLLLVCSWGPFSANSLEAKLERRFFFP